MMKKRLLRSTGPVVGAAVRQLRKDRGWTLETLSAKTDISASGLSQLENGRTTRLRSETLTRRAKAISEGWWTPSSRFHPKTPREKPGASWASSRSNGKVMMTCPTTDEFAAFLGGDETDRSHILNCSRCSALANALRFVSDVPDLEAAIAEVDRREATAEAAVAELESRLPLPAARPLS